MADVNVLVAFYSRYGKTEQLALAAGVGAIQAKASIRLRRIADVVDPQVIQADPDWTRNLSRMNTDYVVPRPADPVWADVIVLGTPADSVIELERYVESLGSTDSLAGKIAAPLTSDHSHATLDRIYALAARAGLIVVPAPTDEGDALATARAHGRRVAEMARALKNNGVQG